MGVEYMKSVRARRTESFTPSESNRLKWLCRGGEGRGGEGRAEQNRALPGGTMQCSAVQC